MSKRVIKNIVLDMGNVLLSFDPEISLAFYVEDEEGRDVIRRELFEGPEWIQQDLGNITKQEMFECIGKRVPETIHPQLKKCVESWDICMKPVEGAREFCEYAKEKGYRLYVLSNAGKDFYRYFPRLLSLDFFDGSVISCDVHMIKPDQGIYKHLFDKYDLIPEECLFIDDREENIEGGIKAGMQVHLFRNDYDDIIKKYRI